jgi:hypothetical protein
MSEETKEAFQLKKVLYEPVAPYFADTYNTLVSVVQGFALGALVYVFSKEINLLIILKSIVTGGTICIIWHRFVHHVQYIAWGLRIIDTLIPMSFAVLQYWLILTIPEEKILTFSIAITCIFFLGVITYINASPRKHLLQLYKEHFGNENFAEDLFSELKNFNNHALILMIVFTAVCAIVTIANSILTL